MHGENANTNKLACCIAFVGFVCRYWGVIKSSYADPVNPATSINNYCLQCLLGGLRGASCEQLIEEKSWMPRKGLVSVSLREKKQEKLK